MASVTGLDVEFIDRHLSYTEVLHYDMIYWNKFDMDRHTHAQGRISSIRLIRIESQVDDDTVR